jgi:hypothetical protein
VSGFADPPDDPTTLRRVTDRIMDEVAGLVADLRGGTPRPGSRERRAPRRSGRRGLWGTAFAAVVAGSGVPTVVWARREDLADAITHGHENPVYLPGLPLPEALAATHDLERAVSRADVVAMAIPSHAYRRSSARAAVLPEPAPVVSLSKGSRRGRSCG